MTTNDNTCKHCGSIITPVLDIDAKLYDDGKVPPQGRLERRIVAALCAHLAAQGWTPSKVYDTEVETKVTDAKSAMELIFNLDDSYLFFAKGKHEHWVRLIGGNGIDIVSDWTYHADDRDSFNAAVNSFDAERFA